MPDAFYPQHCNDWALGRKKGPGDDPDPLRYGGGGVKGTFKPYSQGSTITLNNKRPGINVKTPAIPSPPM